MDKERELKDNNLATKVQATQQRAKWTSSSKFNRILSNLEKSFLNQFSNHGNGCGSKSSSSGNLPSANKLIDTEQKLNPSLVTRAAIGIASAASAAATAAVVQQNKRCNEQLVQKGQHQTINNTTKNKITFQPKSEASRGKMTLNKYQQQIVSTMRPNQLIVNNNKPSIPPPHANHEARNQNHRLLFGGAPLTNDQSYDAVSTTLESPTIRHMNGKGDAKRDNLSSKLDTLRPNSSPASSAKSLPTLTTAKPGSQYNKKSKNNKEEEEESGFHSYEPRQSLITNTNNSSSSIVTTTCDPKKSNNMIVMQTNQVPMGSINFNLTNSTPSQQFIYNFQHPHMKQTHHHHHPQQQQQQQQQTINTHQLVASNQVPILSSVDPSNNCYTNTNQQHQMTNAQILNHSQFSDNHQQFYGLYGPNMSILPIASVDNGQQIYANAPPKPRRYQYYDPNNQTMFTQMITPMTTPSSAITTNALSVCNGNSFIHQQPPFNRQGFSQISLQQQAKQLPLNQSIYNISYLQMPDLYQQGVPNNERPNQVNNQRQHNAYIQQRQVNLPPHPLIKSKSSLDACDLNRFKLDKPLDTTNTQWNTLRVQPKQQQQLIYGSRFDHLNRFPTSVQTHQPGSPQFAQGNLQRSKSVTHLLPEYERHYQMRQQESDNRQQATIGPNFLSVSSASTTNLNFANPTDNQPILQQNQIANISSQLNISQQQKSQQYNDSIQQHNNQMFSTIALRHQHQQQQQRINNWPSHQATPNYNDSNNQQQRINLNKANSAFSNDNKIVRQLQSDNLAAQVGFTEPSLDDKIRYLLIGNDKEAAGLKSYNKNNDSNVLVNHKSNSNLSQVSTAKQLSMPNELLNNRNSILKRERGVVVQNVSSENTNNSSRTVSNPNCFGESELNRIYINESVQIMGNRQQRKYQIVDNKQTNLSTNLIQAGDSTNKQRKNDANSHLIVDLTTPRVLAKTQTTLLPSSTQAESQKRDSWSINQVGLPQLSAQIVTSVNEKQRSPTPLDSGSQQLTVLNINKDDSSRELSSTDDHAKKPICGRTAPYYYSDLKSEEQRQALLSIVQQKSLSPPPQLLSRSADQSSTRLGPKSATLHAGHARLLSESIAQRNQRQNNTIRGNLKCSHSNDFSSASNIAKNIDKLFESPSQATIDQEVKTVQSMLALNDSKDDIDSSHLLSIQTTSESLSSGYCSGDMKNRNFSKSKSLENISQRSNSECLKEMVDKLGNPVYENIRRSDKLMNAINNSTTCLSTSRGNRKVSNNYPVDNNSDESMDSIMGSSIDESDSSLDIIDEIKISPTDNHLTDISQLIEQLKSNHSKLSDEYKSTLIRISKTINTKNKQVNNDHKNEKLARRLQLLELKSKKCESRSKNQLALIQMMENVLKQSKIRASNSFSNGITLDDSVSNSIESKPSILQRDQICSSPCLSFDHQNIKHLPIASAQLSSQDSTSPTINSSVQNSNGQQVATTNRPTQNVIKAIVKEAQNSAKFVTTNEIKRLDVEESKSVEHVSLSTRHHQQSLQNAASIKTSVVRQNKPGAVGKKILDIEMRGSQRNNNPFSNSNDGDNESPSNSDFSVDNDPCGSRVNLDKTIGHEQQELNSSNNNNNICDGDHFIQEDEDFIEFLSTDGPSHRSQFEASQFSASDFNTSTSASESSTSGAGNDSLNSPVNSSSAKHHHLFTISTKNTGILKGAKNERDSININNNNNDEKGSKFNNVLGNVIDVDVCPMNNLSQCSPVNNQST